MKVLAVYTLARAALFLAVYGLIWLIFGRSIEWTSLSALYTALIALVVSALIAFVTLKPLRARLAAQVEQRAARTKAAYDARRAREDDDS